MIPRERNTQGKEREKHTVRGEKKEKYAVRGGKRKREAVKEKKKICCRNYVIRLGIRIMVFCQGSVDRDRIILPIEYYNITGKCISHRDTAYL